MKNKKIIGLALALLIIAGILVVVLKGFNVDIMLKQHDSIEYTMEQGYELKDVEQIAKEVFENKKFVIREIEFFKDAVSINSEVISNEEAEKLVNKLDEKYKNTEILENTENSDNAEEKSTTEYKIISNPKIKLLDLFKPYIIAITISTIAIIAYVGIRFRKLGVKKVIINLITVISLTVLSLVSILAIVRFPINLYIIPIIMLIVLCELVGFCAKNEKKLN